LQALPAKLAGAWTTAKCDPEKQVSYLIEPLTGRQMTAISSRGERSADETLSKDEQAYLTADVLGFSLRGLKGVTDPETGAELELQFTTERLLRQEIQRVTDATFDRLPAELCSELLTAAMAATGLTKPERTNVAFTPGSAGQVSGASETNEPAPTDAVTAES